MRTITCLRCCAVYVSSSLPVGAGVSVECGVRKNSFTVRKARIGHLGPKHTFCSLKDMSEPIKSLMTSSFLPLLKTSKDWFDSASRIGPGLANTRNSQPATHDCVCACQDDDKLVLHGRRLQRTYRELSHVRQSDFGRHSERLCGQGD